MAADLDNALEPGETIVFRTKGRTYGAAIVLIVSVLVGLGLLQAGKFAVVTDLESPYWDLLLTVIATTGGMGALYALVLLIMLRRQRKSPDDLVITNRRLLFSRGEWTRKIESAALDRIERVSWSNSPGWSSLDIVVAGRDLNLPCLRNTDALARALASAAGLAPPPALGRIGAVDLSPLGLFLIVATAFPAIWWSMIQMGVDAPSEPFSLDTSWIDPLVLLAAVGVSWPLYELVGGILTATIMRPFLTAEQMQAGLCAGRPDKWHLRIALKWAGLLYGRPLTYVAC